ncbi:diphosphomevalonate decarboxylase [Candidatus Babeliales bacterium]|nr:diphosphomevalonate decarboxylase [Candidatus Babeliales bacterium]MCF7899626.1 diphosphomevalonate decarboxylase [Candidatus Babeliales bacterium]
MKPIRDKIVVQACANIALIKYWGKRDENLFLPTKNSISISMPNLVTTTCVQENSTDQIILDNKILSEKESKKIVNFLDKFREIYKIKQKFKIITQNNFPTAAGLASSSSGFAAIALGLNKYYDLNLSKKELSILARQGSGSACRSIYNGFVIWFKGQKKDGSDSSAQQLFDEFYWPEFKILSVIVNDQEKLVSSRIAMQQTVNTSSYYKEWLIESENRIPKVMDAIKNKDFNRVGQLAQDDCLGMHKAIRLSNPKIDFWQEGTREIIKIVENLNKSSIDCYFTIDAGPNVKILCLDENYEEIKKVILDSKFSVL